MKKAGIVVTVIGAIGLIAAILIGVFVGGGGIKRVVDTPKMELTNGMGNLALEEDTEYRVFQPSDVSDKIECDIHSPAGEQIELGNTVATLTLEYGPHSWWSTTDFTSEEAGDYSFVCDADAMVASKDDTNQIGTGLAGILGGIFAALFALFILLVGLVLFFVGRHNERKRQRENMQYWGPDYNQPGGPGMNGGPGAPGGPGMQQGSYWNPNDPQNPYQPPRY